MKNSCSQKKCDATIETEINCKATAALEAETQEDLKKLEDKSLKDLLDEKENSQ